MSTAAQIWSGLDWSFLLDTLLSILPAVVCITLHELSHGYVAYKLGDNTAKDAGRLTLNPIKHIDWWGLVMMALCHFGWAKPVPVNMHNFKDPKKGMAITALAGPVANILIAVVFLFLYGLVYKPLYDGGTLAQAILQMVGNTAYLSIALAVFNFIPLPPLDGSKVLFAFLPPRAYEWLMRYERYFMILVIVMILTGALTGGLSRVTSQLYNWLFIFAQWGFALVVH